MAEVYAKVRHIGRNSVIESDIGSPDLPCDVVDIGDNVYIGSGCNIQVPYLRIGDYTKIHRNTLLYGRKPVTIGYNCWVGEGSVLDAEGYLTLGHNVGVGAHSQLWSHIRHGDLLQGCSLYGFDKLHVKHDAWFVGHCIVSPVVVEPFAVALAGSVVTHGLERNHIYGGVPTKDLTDKLGAPFQTMELNVQLDIMDGKLAEFAALDPLEGEYGQIAVVADLPSDLDPEVSYFSISTRQYTKRFSTVEQAFMKFLLPEVKFIPIPEVYA